MTRFNSNIEICDRLKIFFSKPENVDLRFFQGLFALKLLDNKLVYQDGLCNSVMTDPFHEESLKTLKKLNGDFVS